MLVIKAKNAVRGAVLQFLPGLADGAGRFAGLDLAGLLWHNRQSLKAAIRQAK